MTVQPGPKAVRSAPLQRGEVFQQVGGLLRRQVAQQPLRHQRRRLRRLLRDVGRGDPDRPALRVAQDQLAVGPLDEQPLEDPAVGRRDRVGRVPGIDLARGFEDVAEQVAAGILRADGVEGGADVRPVPADAVARLAPCGRVGDEPTPPAPGVAGQLEDRLGVDRVAEPLDPVGVGDEALEQVADLGPRMVPGPGRRPGGASAGRPSRGRSDARGPAPLASSRTGGGSPRPSRPKTARATRPAPRARRGRGRRHGRRPLRPGAGAGARSSRRSGARPARRPVASRAGASGRRPSWRSGSRGPTAPARRGR